MRSIAFLALCCLWPTHSVGKILHSSQFQSIDALLKEAQPGDAIVFSRNEAAYVRLDRAQGFQSNAFFGLNGVTEISTNLQDCYIEGTGNFKQTTGLIRRSVFDGKNNYGARWDLNNLDSVSIYLGRSFNDAGVTKVKIDGKFRGVMIHKGYMNESAGENAEKDWHLGKRGVPLADYKPFIELNARDLYSEFAGQGSYIYSPILWDYRAYTPIQIHYGREITIAHVNTERQRWANPIADIEHCISCVLLANGPGAGGEVAPNFPSFEITPIKLPDGSYALGRTTKGIPFRGPIFRVGGQNNKMVGTGRYQNWTIGLKAWLPGFHYEDGVTMRDPHFESWNNYKGDVSINFADPKGIFTAERIGSSTRLPPLGSNIPRPVVLGIGDFPAAAKGAGEAYLANEPLPLAKASQSYSVARSFGASEVEALYAHLETGGTAVLAEGTYAMQGTVTRGRIVGAGKDGTKLVFAKGVTGYTGEAEVTFATISGGDWGFKNTGSTIGRDFTGVRFENQSEGGILIDGNTQNDVIGDAEFIGGKFGIKLGSVSAGNGYSGDPNVDKLDVVNCDFKGQSSNSIDLSGINPDPNGQVAVLNCNFEDIGGRAVYINGGMTHLVQLVKLRGSMGSASDNGGLIYIRTKGAGSVTHVDIDVAGVKAGVAGVHVSSAGGVISHGKIQGPALAVKLESTNMSVDNIEANGTLEAAGGSLVSNSSFGNAFGAGKVFLLTNGAPTDMTSKTRAFKPDDSPPSAVDPSSISAEEVTLSGRKSVRVTWDAAIDAESGIVGYEILKNGERIGRTTYRRKTTNLMGSTSTLAGSDTFGALEQFDHIGASGTSGYEVVAVNGANKTPEGSFAPLRAWTFADGLFFTPEGKPFRVHTAANCCSNSDAAKFTDTLLGETYTRLQFKDGTSPKYITAEAGPVLSEVSGSVHIVPPLHNGGFAALFHAKGFSLQQQAHVRIRVLDIQGRQQGILHDGYAPKGYTPLPTEPSAIRNASGRLFATMEVNGRLVDTRILSLGSASP